MQGCLKISHRPTIPTREKASGPSPLVRNSHVGTPHPGPWSCDQRPTSGSKKKLLAKNKARSRVFLAPYAKGFQKHNFPEWKGRTQHTMLVFANLSFLKGALWPSSWRIHWKFLKISQTPKCIIPQLSGPRCEQASKLP